MNGLPHAAALKHLVYQLYFSGVNGADKEKFRVSLAPAPGRNLAPAVVWHRRLVGERLLLVAPA